jgi:hypothetical protein
MNRCALAAVFAATTLFVSALAPTPAAAQMARNFRQSALRGEMVFSNPPELLLNGRAAQLAPGARIHGQDNMLLMSGAIVGQKAVVNYTLDPIGQPQEVWVLRPEEIAKKPWPRSTAEAQAWQFDAASQTWTQP